MSIVTLGIGAASDLDAFITTGLLVGAPALPTTPINSPVIYTAEAYRVHQPEAYQIHEPEAYKVHEA